MRARRPRLRPTALRSRRSHPGRREGGAAAVEFALVAPVLFLLLFGIIDYGIWFADSITIRQAARDAARQGSVENFGPDCGASGSSKDMQTLACLAKGAPTLGGQTFARVGVAPGPGAAIQPSGWTPGATLRVCLLTTHDSLLPLVPFPNGGVTTTRVDIPIEKDDLPGAPTRTGYSDPLPGGLSWGPWCPP